MPNPKIEFDDRPPTKSDLTAERARKLATEAESLNSSYARAETEVVLKQIEQAAKQAKRSCSPTIAYTYRDIIKKRLRELGFKVTEVEGDQRDREPGYTSISW